MKMIKAVLDNKVFRITVLLVIVGLNVLRVRYGVDFTDETWYVAEPFIVAKGAVPFAEVWSQAPGFTIPLFWFFKLYLYIVGSTDGIVLFSRILYLIWSTGVVFLTYFMCKKNFSVYFFYPALCISVYSIFDINYNTIGLFYSFLSMMILFARGEDEKNQKMVAFVSGLSMARSVLGTPSTFVMAIASLIALVICKRMREAIFYVIGGGSLAVIVVAVISYLKGIRTLLFGLKCILVYGSYKMVPTVNVWYTIKNSVNLDAFVAVLSIYVLIKLVVNNKQIQKRIIVVMLWSVFLFGLYYGLKYDISLTLFYGFFEGFFAYAEMEKEEKSNSVFKGLLIIQIINLFWYISSSLMSWSKFSAREYILFLNFLISAFFLIELLKKWGTANSKSDCLYLIMCIVLIVSNYSSVYRDRVIYLLDETVESGIWKGCITNKEKANAILFFEDVIDKNTKDNEDILFMDWASWGYLMSNGDAFSPTTLSPEFYSYGVSNTKIFEYYFDMKGKFPDKIIYCDYGRDDELSIENDEWDFNKYVNSYYVQTCNTEDNGYRVIVYEHD